MAKHPNYLGEYISRKRRLSQLLDVSVSQISQYFEECWAIWNEIDHLTARANEFRISKERLEVLYAGVRAIKPQTMVETGVAGGASSWAVLQAMQKNGRGTLHSIDKGDIPFEVGHLVPKPLRKDWDLVVADSKDELPKMLERLGKIDTFFHDSLHTYEHMMFEFETAWPYLRERKIIFADDTELNNSFQDFCRKYAIRNEQFYGFTIGLGSQTDV